MKMLTKIVCGIGLASVLAIPLSASANPTTISTTPTLQKNTQVAYYRGVYRGRGCYVNGRGVRICR